MPQVSITIKNLPAIKRAFAKAPGLMATNLNKAIYKSVLSIERDSRIFTPVDTGRLRASHRTVFRPFYGEVGTHVNYDTFVHEGTRYMRGRPFMRNAAEKNQGNVDKFMQVAVQDTLDAIGRAT